jgi:hypothetical protein
VTGGPAEELMPKPITPIPQNPKTPKPQNPCLLRKRIGRHIIFTINKR